MDVHCSQKQQVVDGATDGRRTGSREEGSIELDRAVDALLL